MKERTNQGFHSHNGNSASALNQVFPYKVCINLDRRADRWQRVRKQFDRHDIRGVLRFPAVDGQTLDPPPGWTSTKGAYGCLLSHLQIVRHSRERGAPNVLIFEDDVVLADRCQEHFSIYIRQLPASWDMLHFGALHVHDPIEVSENIHRIRRAYSTYAYALNRTVFEDFIELGREAKSPVDVNNLILQSRRACYCFAPHLAWEESGYSDAQERPANHWYLRESLLIHGSGMDDLLRQTSLIIAHQNSGKSESATQNLLFLARFYSERLSGINVIIVEQDREPTISPASLPPGSQYVLVREDGPIDKGRCFNAGVKIAPNDSRLMIFSDDDIFLEEWDICGNLRMCSQYDCATGFDSTIELTSADTLNLRRDQAVQLRWFNAMSYPRSDNSRKFAGFCVFNRQTIESRGGWREQASECGDLRLFFDNEQSLRVFESPNYALRLHHD